VAAIKADFDLLLTLPRSGPPREHLAPNLRVRLHGSYAAYYTPTAREVIIVRVHRGAALDGLINLRRTQSLFRPQPADH
jgi:toxin ParE1/3/4